jgi:hypothetical protein
VERCQQVFDWREADSTYSHGIKGVTKDKYNATTAPLHLVPQSNFKLFYKAMVFGGENTKIFSV